MLLHHGSMFQALPAVARKHLESRDPDGLSDIRKCRLYKPQPTCLSLTHIVALQCMHIVFNTNEFVCHSAIMGTLTHLFCGFCSQCENWRLCGRCPFCGHGGDAKQPRGTAAVQGLHMQKQKHAVAQYCEALGSSQVPDCCYRL